MTLSLLLLLMVPAVLIFSGCKKQKPKNMEADLKDFIKKLETQFIPIYKETNLAYWNSQITGDSADFKKYEVNQIKMNEIFSNKDYFKTLKTIKDSGNVKDELLKRQLDLLYNSFLRNQVDTAKLNAITRMEVSISQKYNTFRADVNGKKFTDNMVEETLKKSTNSTELKNVWIAQKKVGALVAADIIKLVKMRNELAKEIGFNNFHEMSLKLSEQDPEEISKLFDELDNLTRDAFAGVKNDVDKYFAARYKIGMADLRPWHYQNRFFQEAPAIYKVDLNKYYPSKDQIVKVTAEYYKGIGLDISDLMAKSDLFEKEKKCQHAFCQDMDNEGDVRVLCNVTPSEEWMNTMLHEFGHSAYDKYIDNKNLPFFLRDPAHTFTTEAIAEMFGKFSSNPKWLKDVMKISDEEMKEIQDDCYKSTRLQQLVFSRWSQVMYHFEKGLYENPDQDLNKLWWDLVEKYQMLKRPEGRNEPDWAAKIHIATSPCYYHNYLMGELMASQLYYYMVKNILKSDDYKNQSFNNQPEIGKYLIEKVFAPGSRYYWNDMIEKATGEKLTPKYYAEQFVK